MNPAQRQQWRLITNWVIVGSMAVLILVIFLFVLENMGF
jgi:hypothetical protein